jgi:hypothetical protein
MQVLRRIKILTYEARGFASTHSAMENVAENVKTSCIIASRATLGVVFSSADGVDLRPFDVLNSLSSETRGPGWNPSAKANRGGIQKSRTRTQLKFISPWFVQNSTTGNCSGNTQDEAELRVITGQTL